MAAKKQQGSKSSYSNVNVGQKEEGAAAAAARARAQQQQQHPYGRSKGGAAGAGMTPDQSAAFMHSGGAAGPSSSAAAAAGQPARKVSVDVLVVTGCGVCCSLRSGGDGCVQDWMKQQMAVTHSCAVRCYGSCTHTH